LALRRSTWPARSFFSVVAAVQRSSTAFISAECWASRDCVCRWHALSVSSRPQSAILELYRELYQGFTSGRSRLYAARGVGIRARRPRVGYQLVHASAREHTASVAHVCRCSCVPHVRLRADTCTADGTRESPGATLSRTWKAGYADRLPGLQEARTGGPRTVRHRHLIGHVACRQRHV